MPTEKRRIIVTLDDWMWEALERYRYENHIMSMSKAAIELIEAGLEKRKTPTNKPEPRKLDEAKIKKTLKTLNDLLSELEKER